MQALLSPSEEYLADIKAFGRAFKSADIDYLRLFGAPANVHDGAALLAHYIAEDNVSLLLLALRLISEPKKPSNRKTAIDIIEKLNYRLGGAHRLQLPRKYTHVAALVVVAKMYGQELVNRASRLNIISREPAEILSHLGQTLEEVDFYLDMLGISLAAEDVIAYLDERNIDI